MAIAVSQASVAVLLWMGMTSVLDVWALTKHRLLEMTLLCTWTTF